MRVLLIAGSYPPMKCGVGDYSYNLANSLAFHPEIQVGVLTSFCAGQVNKPTGIEIFPVMRKWGLSEISKFKEIIRSWSPDIVHIQYPTQGYGSGLLPWLLPMICFLMKKKIVQTWHEGFSRRNVLKLFLISIIPGKLVVVRPQYKERILNPIFRWALWRKNPLFIRNASSVPCVELNEQKKEVLKRLYLKKQKRLVVFFGFVYPHKGVELLFQIADTNVDQIVIAGEIDKKGNYYREIIKLFSSELWQDKVTVTGFLPKIDAAELLAVADAVIFPFRDGGGEWNTSIHGAVLNRAFVITTSRTQSGYDKKRNIYFAKVDDVQQMRSALAAYAGTRREYDVDIDKDEWLKIASEHYSLYKSLLPT